MNVPKKSASPHSGAFFCNFLVFLGVRYLQFPLSNYFNGESKIFIFFTQNTTYSHVLTVKTTRSESFIFVV